MMKPERERAALGRRNGPQRPAPAEQDAVVEAALAYFKEHREDSLHLQPSRVWARFTLEVGFRNEKANKVVADRNRTSYFQFFVAETVGDALDILLASATNMESEGQVRGPWQCEGNDWISKWEQGEDTSFHRWRISLFHRTHVHLPNPTLTRVDDVLAEISQMQRGGASEEAIQARVEALPGSLARMALLNLLHEKTPGR